MYVDGYVLAVPEANKQAYIDMATMAGKVFIKHGALTFVECWGDDVPEGKVNSFHTAVMREEGEQVMFSWVTWPDKATRDAGMKAVMEDPDMKMPEGGMPLDGKRMILGGFRPIVEMYAEEA